MTRRHPIELAQAQRIVENWARQSFWRRRGFATRLQWADRESAGRVELATCHETRERVSRRVPASLAEAGALDGAPVDPDRIPAALDAFSDSQSIHLLPGTGVQSTCDACGGQGMVTCGRCRGSGWVTVRRRRADGGYGEESETCETCGGSGRVTCPTCQGEREVVDRDLVIVRRHTTILRSAIRAGEGQVDDVDGDVLFEEVSEPGTRLLPRGATGGAGAYRGREPRVDPEVDAAIDALLARDADSPGAGTLVAQRVRVIAVPILGLAAGSTRVELRGKYRDVFAEQYPAALGRIAAVVLLPLLVIAAVVAWQASRPLPPGNVEGLWLCGPPPYARSYTHTPAVSMACDRLPAEAVRCESSDECTVIGDPAPDCECPGAGPFLSVRRDWADRIGDVLTQEACLCGHAGTSSCIGGQCAITVDRL